ncbi:hypothetical protein [uncultured Gordonia sp.]|uniref:hypothetical protein n=1 Tax=uncultured Gordonia sp. TaxID=198437 RepID=UPI0025851D14|nr:hypothetical protein [uncultured Gordonia sp.]
MSSRNHARHPQRGADDPGQLALFRRPVIYETVPEPVAETAAVVFPGAVVLPKAELSGYRGYSVVRWRHGLSERMAAQEPPMLDRATLSLWEMMLAGGGCAPASAVQIVGFIAAGGRWGRNLEAATALRGFAQTVVLTSSHPTAVSLTAADFVDVTVARSTAAGEVELLVRGRRRAGAPRDVAVRYWEERLFAHALAVGAIS